MFRYVLRRTAFVSALILAAIVVPAGQSPVPQAPPPAVRAVPAAVPASAARLYDFGPGPVAPNATQVVAATAYTRERGYGFLETAGIVCHDRGMADSLRGDFCTSDAAFRFVVDLPQGNYRVTVTLGDAGGDSLTTVRSESRRLMLEHVATARGEVTTRTFVVNTRDARLAAGGSVALKSREIGAAHWDNALTLEFGDRRPAVAAVEIAPAPEATTVFLAGDSTVTDQTAEPYSSWGQMLPRFFGPGVAVANHAESGESLRSFLAERRLEKIFDLVRPGDYLFLQFAHNDQKLGPDTAPYEALLRAVVADARRHGAVPVLLTSMQRRRFDSRGTVVNSLEGFPDAMRAVAKTEGAPLIDLDAMSRRFYEALGPEGSKRAFVHYPAGTFPGQEAELKDDTHFNAYGAYELARAVVEGIRRSGIGLGVADCRRRDALRSRASGFARHMEPAGQPEFEGWGRCRRARAARARPADAPDCRRFHRAEQHAGPAWLGHGHRALLRRVEDQSGQPRPRRSQQPHVPDRGALGTGTEGRNTR